MLEITEDPRRVAVWTAMADHFLDTETRHSVPFTALRCLEAGLTSEEACDVWRYEVTPVVGMNLWSVAGVWDGWDEAWLIEQIRRARASNRLGPVRWLRYRFGGQ